MARENTVTCPSGAVVRFRSIKGKDLDVMRDQRRLRTGESISDLLDACTLEMSDRGIYTKQPQFRWVDALVGDQVAAFIALRRATVGEDYNFRLRCQDKSCREMIDWKLDLNALPVQKLAPADAEIFVNGDNVFTTEVDGVAVRFRLRTGHDQIKLAKRIANMRQLSKNRDENQAKALLGLSSRIIDIAGVEPEHKLAWLEELELLDIKYLIEHLDKHDCGVETTIEIQCQECGLEQEVELPLDNTFFKGMS